MRRENTLTTYTTDNVFNINLAHIHDAWLFKEDISVIDHWLRDYGHKLKYLAKHVAKLNCKKI